MEKAKVNEYLAMLKENVPTEKLLYLKSKLEKASDDCEDSLNILPLKSPTTILISSVLLGAFGVDRFMLGDVGLGVAKLFLGWFTLGIWPLIDIFFCYKKAKEINLTNILACL